MTAQDIASQLMARGTCVCPNYLSEDEVTAVRVDLQNMYTDGRFKAAGTGHGPGHAKDPSIRRDEIAWLDPEKANAAQTVLWTRLTKLQTEINASAFLGLNSFEGHYAVYPVGGFYKSHLDAFKDNDDRMVSIVIYLNHNWGSEDGGQLRIERGESLIDVEPQSGTMVCFLSRTIRHEVLESKRRRLSFSGWFKVRPLASK